ncbi:MAG: dihydroorotate dehydrogenase [Candidatus Krumholzibacteriota bacterium]|nr:dihydroorotate dehydrogenase [Candidatus Krumholzibacteriota bacterium]
MTDNKDIRLNIGRSVFENPVFLASGPAGYGLEYINYIDMRKLGGVVTKTISFEPRAGNPGVRLQETPSGLLNSIGLENVGAELFFREKMALLASAGIKLVISLAAEDWDDYRRLIGYVAERDNIEIVELNLSCPNVERGGMAVGTDPDLLGKYVRLAKELLPETDILAKLTPNVRDIGGLALAAEEAGADGITAINTIVGMDIDLSSSKPVFKRVRAGLSGPAIRPVALDAVWKISRTVKIPVIGVGGISSVDDALKFFMAGAAGIQIGTAIFYDPGLPERIIERLETGGIPSRIEYLTGKTERIEDGGKAGDNSGAGCREQG